jgi:hypothetical protein
MFINFNKIIIKQTQLMILFSTQDTRIKIYLNAAG